MTTASTRLELEIIARDAASKALRDVSREAGLLGSTMKQVSTITAGFTVGNVITQLPSLIHQAARAAAEDAASQAQLKQALMNTGAAWEMYGDALENVASNAERLGFSDEEARRSLSMLLAQTQDADQAQRRFAIAADLSRGANIDLATASRLVGKITDENVNVLGRYGVAIRQGASEAEALAAIQERFGGQAEAFADTAAGSFARLQTAIGNLSENAGAVLLPVITPAVEGAAMLADVINDLLHGGEKTGEFFGDIARGLQMIGADAINPIIDAINDLIAAWNQIPFLPNIDTIGRLNVSLKEGSEALGEQAAAAEAATTAIKALGIQTGLLNDTQDAAIMRSQSWAIWLQNLRDEAAAAGQSLEQLSAAQGLNTSFGAFTGLGGGSMTAAPSSPPGPTTNNANSSFVNYGQINIGGSGGGSSEDIDFLLRTP